MPQCVNRKTSLPKHRYLTLEEAAPHAVGGMHAYPCASCGCWHVGHPPRANTRKKKSAKRFKYAKNPHRRSK